MNTEFFTALELLEKEKGIPKDYMIEKMEAALTSAYKKQYSGASNVRVVIDDEKKDVKIYQQRTVVEEITDADAEITLEEARAVSKRYELGDVVEREVKTKDFNRLSAQAAKQVMIQAIREAERKRMIEEYESKREEIITAEVSKIDPLNGSVVLDTGTGRAVLYADDQIPGETFEVGDRVKVFISEVRKETRGPIVAISRTHPGLVKRLFELEIPEISDGIVLVKSVSREAGSRTKVAVASRDPEVDPVGACIGEHSMRIAGIVRELRGEKLDVIPYSEVPEDYIAASLAPAQVISVFIDGERTSRVIVAPDQLSLAIGKEGQNVRLAARLTGYKIDIKTN